MGAHILLKCNICLSYLFTCLPVIYICRQHKAKEVLISLTYTSGLERIQVRCAIFHFFLHLEFELAFKISCSYKLRVDLKIQSH